MHQQLLPDALKLLLALGFFFPEFLYEASFFLILDL